jgi:four helix bundle protein
MTGAVRSHRDLRVYQGAFELAKNVFDLSKGFPSEERYALTDQFRRASRSVCANLGEAWRKRKYAAAFVAKLNDAEAEAGECQVWAEFALSCGYIDQPTFNRFIDGYEHVLRQLTLMMENPRKWGPEPSKKAKR